MSAVKSMVTSKYRATVPRAIREHLGIGPQDVLQWEALGLEVRRSASRPAEQRGMIAPEARRTTSRRCQLGDTLSGVCCS